MSFSAMLPVLVLLSSASVSFVIFFLDPHRGRLRTALYLGGEVTKLLLVVVMLRGIYAGEEYETHVPLLAGVDLLLRRPRPARSPGTRGAARTA